MEIKMRRKGEVIIWKEFPESSIPQVIRNQMPEGLEGIDLTSYSVISASFGRHGDDNAQNLHAKAPGTIVVYKYNWRNGWGEGILLPERFNPSRVRFYKSAAQLAEEEKQTQRKAIETLCEQVLNAIPNALVYIGYSKTSVEVYPKQEAFSDWKVRASTLEEATEGFAQMLPFWQEWNERALEAFMRHSGRENPGNGNIQIYPNPQYAKKVGVCVDHNNRKWVIFEKQEDGCWVETGVSLYGPPSNY